MAMCDIFHPLHTTLPPPERFTYPFCYEPHPLCLLATERLCDYIRQEPSWQEEIAKGKMFGVLVVERQGQLGYLAAYSGQLCQRNDLPFFVPAVYDMLQPDGPFKQGERQITALNEQVETCERSQERLRLRQQVEQLKAEASQQVEGYKQRMEEAKRQRDLRRSQGWLSEEESEALIKESQYMKAELRRIKKQWKEAVQAVESQLREMDDWLGQLRARRRKMSDDLQQWLFSQFRMCNARGEERDLCDIFAHTVGRMPPAGAGECCAPKLLQYAYRHAMRPVCMAEFWWGESPKAEVRHHLHFYPACRGKCKPILEFMLQGLDVDSDPLSIVAHHPLDILYEDDVLAVVCKPSGMLSVPGRGGLPSVYSVMQHHCGEKACVMMVHRLDMDTSGLLVVAKDKNAYLHLQRQFASRTVYKCYVALLDHCPPHAPSCGTVSLPLRPDPLDRPRQVVDRARGKEAVTRYRILSVRSDGKTLVSLEPHTGRTHQLRVHCAHPDGLASPIVGDRLYGHAGGRLCLHAEVLEFTHPLDGRRMRFERKTDFDFEK